MASADAVLRDYQGTIIDRRPLPLLFNISGKGKPPAKPKRAQKRSIRGVASRQHSNYCTLHRNAPLVSDIHIYLAAPPIVPAVYSSVNPPAQEPQHVDNGAAQELITSHMWIPAGNIRQTSNPELCPLRLLSLCRP